MTATALRPADIAALHRCPHDGSLELLYQPEVDLASGAIVAVEGLLRWHHGPHGVLAPPEFMDLAERSGEVGPIGEWVLRTGASEAASWLGMPGEVRRLWLNASLAQLRARGFADLVASVVQEHGLPFGALGLDIAEQTVSDLGEDALEVLSDLRACGVALAIDDFSSWCSTLGAIEALPVDVIKLGHGFVRGIDESDEAPSVQAVIDRAHSRGLVVVAEGVESWAESARLTEMGCDRAHGWWFASPMRSDRARWLLTQGAGWRGGVLPPGAHAVPSPRDRRGTPQP